MTSGTKIMDALRDVRRETTGDVISLGDIATVLNNRGFGTLLIIPSLLVVLPTGAIPFLPAVCALFICLICVQMIMGRDTPWLPERLTRASIKRPVYESAVKKASPFVKKLDSLTHPRLKVLTLPVTERLIAVLCIALALIIMVVAVIPFAADLPAFAILLFALGLSARDGLLTFLGLVVVASLFFILPWFLGIQ